MIHVVTHANRALYVRELLQLHRLRPARDGASAEATRSGWGVYDRGDDERAVYFLCLDDDGGLACGARLRPTDDWSAFAEADRDGTAWELDGPFAAPQLLGPDSPDAWRLRCLRLAIVEEALERGAPRIVCAEEAARLPALFGSGWRLRVAGLPWAWQGRTMASVEIEVGREAVEELRERMGARSARRLNLPGHQSLGGAPLKEVEQFLEAAQRLGPRQLKPLLLALRAAIEEDEGLEP